MDYSTLAIFVVISLSAQWVYADAKKHKIGKFPEKSGLINNSAGAIAGATLLLWIFVFPLYLIKRKALIEKAREYPQEPSGKIAYGISSAIFGVIAIVTIMSSTLPGCDSPDALGLANKIIGQSPLLAMLGGKGGIQNAAEQGYEDSVRICRGFVDNGVGGQIPINYSVSWHDKAKHIIYVQLLN